MKSNSILAFVLIAVFATATAQMHMHAAERRGTFPPEDDTLYLPRSGVIHGLALGHTELAADLLFIRTINYFGAELTGQRHYDWLSRHLDTIVSLDPYFRTPYIFGSRATMYNGLAITNEMVHRSNHFLELGLEQFSDDWEMAFSLGCNYLNELKTTDLVQKRTWRHLGGQWIRRAALGSGGPPWLANLAATILTEQGQREAAIRYLEEAYLTTENQESQKQILNLLAAKRRQNQADLIRAREEFTVEWKRTLPYAPADLFVLLGTPPSARLDLPHLLHDPVLDGSANSNGSEGDAAESEPESMPLSGH